MLVIIQSSQLKACRAIPLTQMRIGIVIMAMAKSAVTTQYERARISSILVMAATAAAVVAEAAWWLKDGGLGTPSWEMELRS
jgi:pyrroline-5-carboxylate reductase